MAAAAFITAFNSSPSQALSFTANLTNFTGDTAGGSITIEDLDGGGVKFSANITEPTINGDIARVAFLIDPNLLDSFSIDKSTFTSNLGGSDKINFDILTGDKACGNVFNGGGSPCKEEQKLNVALDFGRGSSNGLLQDFSFNIKNVEASDFVEAFGLRYQSTGNNQERSSKLGYYYPGYMGTTNQVFYMDADKPAPKGAVLVDEPPKVQVPDQIRVNGEWKNKNKPQNKKNKKK